MQEWGPEVRTTTAMSDTDHGAHGATPAAGTADDREDQATAADERAGLAVAHGPEPESMCVPVADVALERRLRRLAIEALAEPVRDALVAEQRRELIQVRRAGSQQRKPFGL